MNKELASILSNKYYSEQPVFFPENLLREARRQKKKLNCDVPSICLLDPDGDLSDYLVTNGFSKKSECWACYHSVLYSFDLNGSEVGIVPCVVGASYSVLVAEQLFVSGCNVLISVTSAGIINQPEGNKRFTLITEAIRDEGTSYHYLAPGIKSQLNQLLMKKLLVAENEDCPYFGAKSWTTDAPYRETQSAINAMKKESVCCVEMEAAALYAFAEAKQKEIICFAHLTNTMAQNEGDFEKGEHFGSTDTLNLLSYVLKKFEQ